VRTNIITKALQDIHFSIPEEILRMGFEERNKYGLPIVTTVDDGILNKVIRPKVIVDCNLAGGKMVEIDLERCPSRRSPDGTIIYNIPKDFTNGNSIVTALSVYLGFNTPGFGMSTGLQGDGMLSQAARAMSGTGGAPFTPYVELIGENTVAVKYNTLPATPGVLRAIVENNENMSNIPPRAWDIFSQLCMLATKAYIYNNFIIKQGQAELYGGVELPQMRDYIDGMSDAEEMYRELLKEKWWKVSFMIDRTTHQRFLRLKINPSL